MEGKIQDLLAVEKFLLWFNGFKDPTFVYGYTSAVEEAWDLCCQLGFIKHAFQK